MSDWSGGGGGRERNLTVEDSLTADNELTHVLVISWHEQLIQRVNLLPPPLQLPMATPGHQLQYRSVLTEGVGGLRVTEHQLGVQKALDESDIALFTKIGRELTTHGIAQ